jgi:hypothetical protein
VLNWCEFLAGWVGIGAVDLFLLGGGGYTRDALVRRADALW